MVKDIVLIIASLAIGFFFTYKLIFVEKYFKSEKIKLDLKDVEPSIRQYNEAIADIKSCLKLKKKLAKDFSNHNKSQYLSRCVFNNVEQDTIKYVSKYFIPANDDNLKKLKDYRLILRKIKKYQESIPTQRNEIVCYVRKVVPLLVRLDSRLNKKAGIVNYTVPNLNIDVLSFDYVSQKGNSRKHLDFKLTEKNVSKLVTYIENILTKKSNKKYQRNLMTKELRERILKRDHYTCQKCGLSLKKEPHLLLEVDHIVPISKGGKTVEDNLQTLCWSCNRQKGSK